MGGLRLLVVLLLSLFSLQGKAQEIEYQLELGGGIGPTFYMGDTNSNPLRHMGMMGTVVARRVFNPRMVLKGNLAFAHIAGNTHDTYIPLDAWSETPEGGQPVHLSFGRNLFDLGAQYEMNFWGYGTGEGYKGNSRITPYMLAGVGLTLAVGGGSTDFAFNIPIGVGIKYKVKPRLNLGLEWSVRFTTSDKLDVTNESKQLYQPYGVPSNGFKNKDCYSFLLFSITYDMCPKLRKCNN
ncbi:MAG: hypothetical protein KBT12_04165 [Bacteroidales bacterium]|nr:hypothetical protein [Candidatus Physcousia equi]